MLFIEKSYIIIVMIEEYKVLRRIEMGFIEQLKIKAKSNKKTIVLPEGMDRRTYEAAQQIVEEDFADIIILASPEEAEKYGNGYDIENVTIIDPKDCVKTKEYAEEFYMLRKAKGMTETQAYAMLVSDYMYFACMMVRAGDADGVVSGACHSSANTLRPSLQIIKTKPGSKLVSAFFVMCVQNKELGADGVFVMGDCGLNQNPSPEQLADIAASSAESFEYLVGEKARVAMLSHSTHGSAARKRWKRYFITCSVTPLSTHLKGGVSTLLWKATGKTYKYAWPIRDKVFCPKNRNNCLIALNGWELIRNTPM